MFAQFISEATSLGVAVIISETTSFAEGKHHSKKPDLSDRQIRLFCCERLPKRSGIEVRKPKSTPLFLIEIDVQMLLKTKPFHNIMINNII